MNKQAMLDEAYNLAFNDELEKIALGVSRLWKQTVKEGPKIIAKAKKGGFKGGDRDRAVNFLRDKSRGKKLQDAIKRRKLEFAKTGEFEMNKQAMLEDVYNSSLNDELEKIAFKAPYGKPKAGCSSKKKLEISSLINKEVNKSTKDLGLSKKHKKTLMD